MIIMLSSVAGFVVVALLVICVVVAIWRRYVTHDVCTLWRCYMSISIIEILYEIYFKLTKNEHGYFNSGDFNFENRQAIAGVIVVSLTEILCFYWPNFSHVRHVKRLTYA